MAVPNLCEPFLFEGTDPDELSVALSSSRVKLNVEPVTKDGISFKCGFSTTGTFTLGLCRYEGTCLVTREGLSDKFLIFLPRYGNATFDVAGKEIVTSKAQGAILDCAQHHSTLLMGPREHVIVVVDRQALQNSLTSLLETPISGNLDFLPEIKMMTGPGMAISRLAFTLGAGLAWEGAPLRNAPLALTALSDALTQIILETLPHRFSTELHRAVGPMPRHVKRAVEFMKANLANPLRLQDIATACGVSQRALQQGFRQFKMTTPSAYLQYLRLEAVHRELLQATSGQTVSDIALKWGFTHLGRMSADYRQRFGQLPSQTLRLPAGKSNNTSGVR